MWTGATGAGASVLRRWTGETGHVSGIVSNTSITVNAGDGTKSISFTASVSLPTTGKAPYPAIIGTIGGSIIDVTLN